MTTTAWGKVPLGDVACFVRGITFKPTDKVDHFTPDAIPCLRTKNVQARLDLSDLIYLPRQFTRREDQMVRAGDTLISTANSKEMVGKCSFVDDLPFEATLGGFIAAVRPRLERVVPSYLYRWISSPGIQATLRRISRQTTNIANLPLTEAAKLKVPLPSLKEQERIVAILDAAEELRRLREQADQRTADLIPALFHEMFGDPDSNPNHYPLVTLKSCTLTIQTGPFGSLLHQADYVEGGVPVINPMHIQGGIILPSMSQTVTPSKHSQLTVFHLRKGDVVMGRRGAMGRCALVTPEHDGLLCGTGSLLIRPDVRKASGLFMAMLLSSGAIRRRLESLAQGVTLLNLNSRIIENLKVPLPPITSQAIFKSLVVGLRAMVTEQAASRQRLDDLFQSLLHRAFRGEL